MTGRRLLRALLAVLVMLPLVVAAALTPAERAAAADPAARIELDTLDPAVGVPGATLRAAGLFRVTSNQILTDVELRLRLSRTRLNSRGELAAAALDRTSSRDGDIVARQQLPGRLATGSAIPFALSTALDDVPELREFGVHVLSVEAVATTRDASGRVAIVRTFLPWVPTERDFQPSGFAWLWPLLAAPGRLPDGTFADDRLASEMATDGRLGQIVAAGSRLAQQMPLTWVMDPALLETAQDMSDGYTVRAPAGSQERVVDGTGPEIAAGWLEQVRSGSALNSVLSLPYADPDLVALQRGNLRNDLMVARDKGDALALEILGRPVGTDVAWPAEGYANRATLRALRGLGMQAAILDARAIPAELDLPFTPTGRADVPTPNGTLTGLLYDPVLSDALGAGANQQPLLAAQRFVAETAMITAELPGLGPERAVLIAPPRRWSPPAALLERVVDVSLQAPWLSPVAVSDLRASPPPEIDRERIRYPRSVRRNELPPAYLDAVRDVHTRIATFAAVLVEPDSLVPALDAAVLGLESTWWRNRDARTSRLVAVRDRVIGLRDQVRVLPGSYTFGSKSGTIPLTVANDLDQAVTVDILLTPLTARLEIGDVRPVRIDAESKVQVEVPARAVANGLVLVRTSLRTPEGEPYGVPVQLRVQVTQYGTVALFITIGAAAVLGAAAALRLFRRAAAARRTSSDTFGSTT